MLFLNNLIVFGAKAYSDEACKSKLENINIVVSKHSASGLAVEWKVTHNLSEEKKSRSYLTYF